MDKELKKMIKVFKALSDETRQRILELLCREEMNVSDICQKFDTTQPTISHHLQILKNCDLVDIRKDGKMVYYCINREVINDAFGEVIERFHIVIDEE